ncbi:MAG: HAMP domain-containing histidine kinase [Campylobacterales bacterium]|nr:HAMP domain-containing histidine kinase [Campylobacterales bacterium]
MSNQRIVNKTLFLDSVNSGVVVVNSDLNVKFFNSWLEAHTDKKRDEVIGRPITEVFPEIKEKVLSRKVKNCLKLKSPTFYDAEVDGYLFQIPADKIIYSTFEYMQQNVTIAPYDVEKDLVSLMIYDQTQFLEMKRRCVDFNEELQRQVKIEVQKQKEQEDILLHQSRMASMGEMIGNIAHQWKQPLNGLSIYIQMIYEEQRNKQKISQEFIQEFYEKTMFQIKGMSQTVDDFKNFFKVNRQKKDFYLKRVIENSLRLVDSYYTKHKIEINIDYQVDEDLILKGFDNELIQVFVNILNNGKDALIEKKIDNPKMNIIVSETAEFTTVEFEDNAGGIPDDIMKDIFVPYFTTKDDQGTGIGLYMSQRIVNEHLKGTISVSNKNQGACFKIRLPKT